MLFYFNATKVEKKHKIYHRRNKKYALYSCVNVP